MTDFASLLKAKDKATEAKVKAAGTATVAADDVAKAQAALAKAAEADQAAEAARLSAHKAIHDHLAELGEHYLVSDDGTITIYRAIDAEPGWTAQQPIPGGKLPGAKGK